MAALNHRRGWGSPAPYGFFWQHPDHIWADGVGVGLTPPKNQAFPMDHVGPIHRVKKNPFSVKINLKNTVSSIFAKKNTQF